MFQWLEHALAPLDSVKNRLSAGGDEETGVAPDDAGLIHDRAPVDHHGTRALDEGEHSEANDSSRQSHLARAASRNSRRRAGGVRPESNGDSASRFVGVSFGGLVALRFAATRQSRTAALVMVSAPGPHWHLRPRHDMYRADALAVRAVVPAESPWRLRQEVMAALPEWPARRRYLLEQLRTIVAAPASLPRMAARARLDRLV